jgi:plastocyanin
MRMNRCIMPVAVLALLVGLGAKADTTVTIKNLSFSPGTVTVKVGDAVTWVNADDRDHNVTGGELRSGNIKQGKSWSYTFKKAGKYNYVCTLHPRMHGAVIVND